MGILSKEIDVDKFSTNTKCNFYLDKEENVLTIKVSGICGIGSAGSSDVNKIFLLTTGYYFTIEPLIVFFDLSHFHYEWCNTFLKILNYPEFIAKHGDVDPYLKTIFLISDKNEVGIASLLDCETNELPQNYFRSFEAVEKQIEFILEEFNNSVNK